MNVRDVLKQYERAVVIAHYRPAEQVHQTVYQGCPPPQNPACYLQIALIAGKVSPSGKLIRLGETKGDEIFGWQNLDALDVVEILGELALDGATVTPIASPNLLEMKRAVDKSAS